MRNNFENVIRFGLEEVDGQKNIESIFDDNATFNNIYNHLDDDFDDDDDDDSDQYKNVEEKEDTDEEISHKFEFRKDNWEFYDSNMPFIEVDGVSDELLRRAKSECTSLINIWVKTLKNNSRNDNIVSDLKKQRDSSLTSIYNMWISSFFYEIVYNFASDGEDLVKDDLHKFFIVILFMSFYKMSPTMFYDIKNCDSVDNKARMLLKRTKFFSILNTLRSKKKKVMKMDENLNFIFQSVRSKSIYNIIKKLFTNKFPTFSNCI